MHIREFLRRHVALLSGGLAQKTALFPVLLVGSCGVPLSVTVDAGSLFGGGREASSPSGEICEVGRRTTEGIECPAFRSETGDLYTLVGSLVDDVPDDSPVCLCMSPVEASFCQQGMTMVVEEISRPESC